MTKLARFRLEDSVITVMLPIKVRKARRRRKRIVQKKSLPFKKCPRDQVTLNQLTMSF